MVADLPGSVFFWRFTMSNLSAENFIVFEQLFSGYVRHVFTNRIQFATWMKNHHESKMIPSNQIHGRCFGSDDHRDDFLLDWTD